MSDELTFTDVAEPRTLNFGGNNTRTQSYTLPPGIAQYIEAVYVEVDNTAGARIQPTLTIKEQSGVVIATKRPGESIPAGDTGSVTWALRLDGDDGAIHFGRNFGDILFITTDGAFGIQLTAVGGPIVLNADNDVIVETPLFLSEPQNVNATHTFNARLGKPTTGSHFIVNHVGVGNPAIDYDVDADTISFNLNVAGSKFQVGNAGSEAFEIFGDTSSQFTLKNSGAQFTVENNAAEALIFVDGTNVVQLYGKDIIIQNTDVGNTISFQNSSGTTVFRIDDNGDLHGLTGKTLTFDL